MTLKLYHNPVSTCSQKVRLALAEKGLAYEERVIDWSIWEHLSDWYLAINPNGVVPALVDDGVAIVDSAVICEYIDDICPEPPIAPRTAQGRAHMRAWMRYFEEVPTVAIRAPSFNARFAKMMKGDQPAATYDAMMAKMPLRKHFYQQMSDTGFPPAMVAESMEKLRKSLERVSRALADGRPFLLGAEYSIADIVFVPTVVRMVDLGLSGSWSDLPLIQEWLDRVEARPSFPVAYMPGARLAGPA